jgi:hypothetical protein
MFKAFDFCLPTRAAAVPSGPDWLHEVKYDGFRLRIERDGDRIRLITRGGYDWTKRFPWIAESALKNRIKQFVIDGEAVVLGVDGISDFNALHSGKHNEEVQLCAFDVLAMDGDDLRRLAIPLIIPSCPALMRPQLRTAIILVPIGKGNRFVMVERHCWRSDCGCVSPLDSPLKANQCEAMSHSVRPQLIPDSWTRDTNQIDKHDEGCHDGDPDSQLPVRLRVAHFPFAMGRFMVKHRQTPLRVPCEWINVLAPQKFFPKIGYMQRTMKLSRIRNT